MRVLVISDIHGNLPALDAVLQDAGQVDAAWCLGDLVGYGAEPNEVIARVRGLPSLTCVLGNHDAAACGKLSDETFNDEARQSIRWTKEKLTAEALSFLVHNSEKQVVGNTILVHGSPRHPLWEYLIDPFSAAMALEGLTTPYGITGHTHHPLIFFLNADDELSWVIPEEEKPYQYKQPVFFNPGAVGQPRDHDWRASYAIFDPDTGTWVQHRVAYDVFFAQQKIRQAGLPLRHALRLSDGW